MRIGTVLLILSTFFTDVFGQASSQFKLANIFSDNMVIQRDMRAPVWGKASPGETVSVEFSGHTISTRADEDGKWMVRLPTLKAGGPYEMKVTERETIILNDVMVGEVWLASGQSNMEFSLRKSLTAAEDIAEANYPDIRLFNVPFDVSLNEREDIKKSRWMVCNPETATYFSAVAYHFARNLHETLKVPIGVINASKGSTPVEPWTSAELLSKLPEFKDKLVDLNTDPDEWYRKVQEIQTLERARSSIVKNAADGLKLGVNKNQFDDSQWQDADYPLNMPKLGKPGYWGFVWLRKSLSLPEKVSKPLELSLPVNANECLVYFNGEQINAQPLVSPSKISVPADLVRAGENTLAIRLLSYYGKASLGEDNKKAIVSSADKKLAIELNGKWKFNFDIEPKIISSQNYYKLPSVLYNAMIAPLMPFAIKGVIWYQGEANTVDPYLYEKSFPALIEGWRKEWGIGDFPFLYVQLAGYSRPGVEDIKWALLREVQSKSLNIANTGMATAVDVGEEKDIHPRNKKDVGRRLALTARKVAYQEDIISQGPTFKKMTIKGNEIWLEYDNLGKGLNAEKLSDLKGFVIAGKDQVFYPAKASIIGDKVVVWSEQVNSPVATRYAFESYPTVDLYNQDGLPAIPFRTDNWLIKY